MHPADLALSILTLSSVMNVIARFLSPNQGVRAFYNTSGCILNVGLQMESSVHDLRQMPSAFCWYNIMAFGGPEHSPRGLAGNFIWSPAAAIGICAPDSD